MGPILLNDNDGNADATTITEVVCQQDEDVQYEMDLETYENVFRRDPYAYVGCSAADTELDVTVMFGAHDADDETVLPSSSARTCHTSTAGCEEETDTGKPILRAASVAGRILATGNQSPPEEQAEFADMPVQTRVATTAVVVVAAAITKTTIAAPTSNGQEQSAVTTAQTVSSMSGDGAAGTSRRHRRVGVLTLEARIVLYNAVLDRCIGMDCIKDGAFCEHPLSVQLQAIAQRHQVDIRMVQAIWRHIQSAVHSDDSNNDDNSDAMNLVFVRKRTAIGTSTSSSNSPTTASPIENQQTQPLQQQSPYHTKISIAHPALRLLRYAKRQQICSEATATTTANANTATASYAARAVVSPSDVRVEESVPVPKTSNETTPQATPKPQLQAPSPSPQQLRKSLCHALLDRCLPNGQLPADATECVARQFGLCPPDVQAIWMGMLATAAAARSLLTAAATISSSGATVAGATSSDHDDGCTTDRSSTSLRETQLDLNLDTAYAAMQRIVAIRQKRTTTGAKSMSLASTTSSKSSTTIGENAIVGTAANHHVTLPLSNTSVLCSGPPTLQNAIEFLSRKFFDDHQCNEHAFRADAHVAMMVNHLHFLRRRNGGLGHADRCFDTNSFLLQTTISTNVQNTEKQGEPAARLCLCDAYNLDNLDCRLFSIQPLNDRSVDMLFGTSTAKVLCLTCRAKEQKRVESCGVNTTMHNVVHDTPVKAKGDDLRVDALPNVVLNSAYLQDSPCSSQALPPSPKRPKLGSVKDDCSYRRVPRLLLDEEEWAV